MFYGPLALLARRPARPLPNTQKKYPDYSRFPICEDVLQNAMAHLHMQPDRKHILSANCLPQAYICRCLKITPKRVLRMVAPDDFRPLLFWCSLYDNVDNVKLILDRIVNNFPNLKNLTTRKSRIYLTLGSACTGGGRSVVKYMIEEHNITVDDLLQGEGELFASACCFTDLEFIQWLCGAFNFTSEHIRLNKSVGITEACMSSQVHITRWLIESFDCDNKWLQGDHNRIFQEVFKNGSRETVTMPAETVGPKLREQRPDILHSMMRLAYRHCKSLDLFKLVVTTFDVRILRDLELVQAVKQNERPEISSWIRAGFFFTYVDEGAPAFERTPVRA